MRLPNASPGEGADRDFDSWSNWEIVGGQKHNAHYAGGAQFFIAHPSDKGTKPCLHWMTKGALPCRFCAAHKLTSTVGYVPVWRWVDGRPKLVIVYEDERDHIDKLELHDRLLIGREDEKGARIWVRKAMEQEPKYQTTLLRRKVEQDVSRSLLLMWGIPELSAWLVSNRTSDNAVSLKSRASPDPTPGGPVEASKDAAQPYVGVNRMAGEGAFGDALGRTLEKTREWERSKNGNGKPHGEGQ